ncbi:uncharacterized protein METZ01_LOCUS209119, partial [marine metagenome]
GHSDSVGVTDGHHLGLQGEPDGIF